ncbi:hypothetical protein HaLaN_05922 [Haematococcus lacustris]|uniref:Uncharacterized protein n=1 Tax=Haematococcus lacustris TaxID=44745 RepID=A0A699YMQ1_HAELA|nr:hypothetical protein HaLaN_05922 [Haematococcus lacustris]
MTARMGAHTTVLQQTAPAVPWVASSDLFKQLGVVIAGSAEVYSQCKCKQRHDSTHCSYAAQPDVCSTAYVQAHARQLAAGACGLSHSDDADLGETLYHEFYTPARPPQPDQHPCMCGCQLRTLHITLLVEDCCYNGTAWRSRLSTA